MADRTVPTTDTLEQMRQEFNSLAADVGDIANLNATFSGTPTDLVEKASAAALPAWSTSFSPASLMEARVSQFEGLMVSNFLSFPAGVHFPLMKKVNFRRCSSSH